MLNYKICTFHGEEVPYVDLTARKKIPTFFKHCYA